jgi:aquaporin Z
MISACGFTIALFHPGFPASRAISSDLLRRALMGLAMGLTAIALVYSPMGQRSGAHMNPAVTLTFWRLGKVATWDAAGYIVAQFVGGIAGVALMMAVANRWLMHETVNFVATIPGSMSAAGLAGAWLGEFLIAGILMFVILCVSNRARIARFTPLFAGMLVMLFITFEAPISGMSMNPARSFGSAFWAHAWSTLWIYFTAPPLAMLAASRIYQRLPGIRRVYCAKLHHFNNKKCIFNCEFERMLSEQLQPEDPEARRELQTGLTTDRTDATDRDFKVPAPSAEVLVNASVSSASSVAGRISSPRLHVSAIDSRQNPSALDRHLSQQTQFYG